MVFQGICTDKSAITDLDFSVSLGDLFILSRL